MKRRGGIVDVAGGCASFARVDRGGFLGVGESE